MIDPERQGGWGSGGQSVPSANPFGQPAPSQLANPFAQPPVNPFLQKQPNGVAAAANPFQAKPAATNPFLEPPASTGTKRSISPFDRHQQNTTLKPHPFAKPINGHGLKSTANSGNNSSAPNPFLKTTSASFTQDEAPTAPALSGKRRNADAPQPARSKQLRKDAVTAAAPIGPRSQVHMKRKIEDELNGKSKFSRRSPDPNLASLRSRPHAQGPKNQILREIKPPEAPVPAGQQDDFAKKILNQLAKDNVKPPPWPANPGSYSQRQAIEAFRESYKSYREKARKSLIRAGLIDDPDQKRTLDKALVFRGICEDMCPEWEKVTRIVEHDIRLAEKGEDDNGDLVAMPPYMVKRLARSAAGQDAPLPMDVRSFAALRRTLDYLIDELIPSDDLLPSRHSFLWDRTRAIRIDFSYQKYAMTAKERTDQIYCLETIARFHVTALHLLSQEGIAPEDFSEQQEIEQLGKTLISLIEVYDDCAQQGIECENEAEFRGYHIIFNAHNPSLMETIQGWDRRFLETEGIKTAVCLVQSIGNSWSVHGPLNPYAPTELAINTASIFFSIVATPQVSYTMACFAEIHFNSVRKSILQVIRRAFSRPRDGPKDLTPAFLKQYLRTDTEAEAIEFFEKHGFEFRTDGDRQYLYLNGRQEPTDPRIRHSFSQGIVERKRSGRPLPQVIHQTVYEDIFNSSSSIQVSPDRSPEESLFVSDAEDAPHSSRNGQGGHDSEAEIIEPTPPSSPPTRTAERMTSALTQLPCTSIPAQPNGDTGVQSSHPLWNATGTTQTPGNSSNIYNSWPPKPQSEGAQVSNTSASSFLPTKDTFKNDVSRVLANPPPASSATPGLFGFLNKDESKGETTLPAAPPTQPLSRVLSKTPDSSNKDETYKLPTPGESVTLKSGSTLSTPPVPTFSPFPGLLPKTSDPPNADSSQHVPSSASTTLGSGFQPMNPPEAISNIQPRNPSVFSPNQPRHIPQAEQSLAGQNSTLLHSQSTRSSITTSSTGLSYQVGTTDTAVSQAPPQKDVMGDFTRWFVCGDKGLMKSWLVEFAVEHVLKEFWDEFQASEKERIRREEDEKSWAEARKFREYSLSVTYFYRWRDGFRKRQVVRRIKMEKEKARQWRLPENVAKREQEAKAAKEKVVEEATHSILKRSIHNVDEAVKMRESTRSSRSSLISGEGNIEEALLATGVFRGVRDERAAARLAAKAEDPEPESEMTPSEKVRLRSENQRRRKHGLPPLKQLPAPKVFKEGSKTAMLRAGNSGAGRDSMSISTGSMRNSTFSSSYRSSIGYNNNNNNNRVSKSQSRVRDPYWRLKAHGFVRMPNGQYLHETIALPILQEKERQN
ncbi:SAC3/GANP/Nin1/mts3/eIF-3 p25 family-domain-containing protein [Durotheca rogersii]|uniref:SAC3/GANP/Nin1/mts3/eIF-3 p25 family-domain-containing protein n=1 Tax=Durotheca rogersii TaxID=419775 RepID=UPI00221EAB0B|nr:SAC3/GANP/Nin1/mts3/eIF-3 p25 family-domain-containing protein [Durotheca rogersii]KAI5867227.1 SAC3/GANP/Nin1/mts3/eIF-3 p25 family-domain-containing protein [Durotheca rogersii]